MRHGTPTFPVRHTRSEERINLVNKYYSGRQTASQRENAADKLLAFSDVLEGILVSEGMVTRYEKNAYHVHNVGWFDDHHSSA